MKKLDFYNVPADYVNYLRAYEERAQGLSHVPFVDYEEQNRRGKFFCGIVLQINDMEYYVPVSSKRRTHKHTFFLHDGIRIMGSLRFDYMFPVPSQLITQHQIGRETEPVYQNVLRKELLFCRQNEAAIQKCAFNTYMEVVTPQKENERSCNFRLLEEACHEYCQEHGIGLEPQEVQPLQTDVEVLEARPRSLQEICREAKAKAAEINQGKQTMAPQIEPEQK